MKKIYLFIALFSCVLFSCGNDEDGMTYAQPIEVGETTDMKAAKEVAEALWQQLHCSSNLLMLKELKFLIKSRRWQMIVLLISLKAILQHWTSLQK